MVTGTGLDAQLGYKLETTVGTAVTPNRFLEFNEESLAFDPTYLEPNGLRVGQKFKRGERVARSRKMVSGGYGLDYTSRNMGALWKAAIGSSVTSPTIIGAGPAYKQVHQTGDLLGKSLTVQVGRPEPSGTVRAHTYRGCKVTGWEFSCSDNDVAKMSFDLDGWDESTATALASASYPTASQEVFNFSHCTVLTLGATIAGTTELTASGGTAVASVVKSLSFKGDNALDTERYGLGSTGLKKEQLEAGTPTITGSFDAEYSKTEFYDVFTAGTSTSLLVKFEAAVLGGADKNTIEFIVPQIYIKKVTPQVSGPEVVKAAVEFEAYQNTAGQNPFQVLLISADSAAL